MVSGSERQAPGRLSTGVREGPQLPQPRAGSPAKRVLATVSTIVLPHQTHDNLRIGPNCR